MPRVQIRLRDGVPVADIDPALLSAWRQDDREQAEAAPPGIRKALEIQIVLLAAAVCFFFLLIVRIKAKTRGE